MISTALLLLATTMQGAAPGEARDLRSVEVLREDCRSSIGRREITLFANGTIRLREGPRGGENLRLAEMTREEVRAIEGVIEGLDFSETEASEKTVEGAWVESCELALAPNASPARHYRYGRYGSHSLAIARVLGIVSDLAERVATGQDRPREIPADYRPRPGDLLERADGELFQVVAPTVDGVGVELVGVRLPLTLYIRLEDLAVEFVRRVERRRGP